jgi:hypothetical protein
MAHKGTITYQIPGVHRHPGLDRPSQRYAPDVARGFLKFQRDLLGGSGVAMRLGETGTRQTATLEYSLLNARAIVTAAAVANADTVTINGTAITATQKRASCTVTVASINANDTVTVNGVVFTAKAEPSGNYQFDSDGSDTTVAAALVAKINAATIRTEDSVNGAGVYNKIEAKNSAGVITLYAIAEGTAGNSYTIATSNGTRLAITNDSSGNFANGAAAVNNEFDYIGDNTRTARSICNCIAASTTAAISSHVIAGCRKAVVACASVAVGDWVEIAGFKLYANATTTDSGGARVATIAEDQWCQGSTDTNDGTSLVNCIHAHPVLGERFFAVNASGTVSIYERAPEEQYAPTVSSSNGTRLAVTVAVNGKFADSTGVLLVAKRPGVCGNINTIATGNGTRLAITQDSTGRLTGGTSTTISL